MSTAIYCNIYGIYWWFGGWFGDQTNLVSKAFVADFGKHQETKVEGFPRLQGVIKITFNFKFWEESSFKISSSS
jgi:hypothetical protein